MVSRIPEELITNIRNSNDIADIVGEYVQLRKQGRNYFGLCPFHGEKTSSFSVAPDKQIYHCFGCGAGGNVFSFIMEIEGVSFVEAAKILADKAGIPLEVTTSESSTKSSENADMIKAHELLNDFYNHALVNTQQGQTALNYLYGRGFTDDSISKFNIGYAFDSWEFTADFLEKRGFNAERMLQAGLLAKRERDQKYVDRFRNRIIFPLQNAQGKTIAFSGRAISPEDEPKYLNSPETAIFNKSKVLYNFKNARLSIRQKKYVVLFEGFADVISADSAGVDNGIATMGTAFTRDHLSIISRVTENVVICFDSDKAGFSAASKTADLILESGKNVKIATMPESLDPDDYIKKYGAEKFRREVIGGALSYSSFKLFYHRRGRNLANQDELTEYLRLISVELSKVQSEVEREVYLKPIAAEFNLSLQNILTEVRKLAKNNKSGEKFNYEKKMSINSRVINQNPPSSAVLQAEENLIYHMTKNKCIADNVRGKLSANELTKPEHQLIVLYLFKYFEEGNLPDFSLFINYLQGERLHSIITKIASTKRSEEPLDEEIEDYIKQIKRQPILNEIEEKRAELKEAERVKDLSKAAQLAFEMIELEKNLTNFGG